MAAASTQFTGVISDEKFELAVTAGVTTRVLNLSEPDDSGDIEVIYLESTVLTKEQALLALEAVRQNILDNVWPRA